MNTTELASLPKGTILTLVQEWKKIDRPTEYIRVTFVGLHTDQVSPGRYVKKALVDLPDGRQASVSVTTLRPRCTCGALEKSGCFCEISLRDFLASGPGRTV